MLKYPDFARSSGDADQVTPVAVVGRPGGRSATVRGPVCLTACSNRHRRHQSVKLTSVNKRVSLTISPPPPITPMSWLRRVSKLSYRQSTCASTDPGAAECWLLCARNWVHPGWFTCNSQLCFSSPLDSLLTCKTEPLVSTVQCCFELCVNGAFLLFIITCVYYLHVPKLRYVLVVAPRAEKEDRWGLQQVLQLRPGVCWLHPQSKRGTLLWMSPWMLGRALIACLALVVKTY